MQSMISYYDYKLFIFEKKNDTLKLVKKNKNILILASTFPLSENDPVPSFVRDQIELIKYFYPNLNFFVVSPSNKNKPFSEHDQFKQYRHRYFLKKFEKFGENGILPTLKKNFLYFFLVPFLIFSQIIYTFRFVRKNEIDLIYAHWVTPQAITALFVNVFLNTPFVFSSHTQDAQLLTKIPVLGKVLLNLLVKRAKSIHFGSEATKNYLLNSTKLKDELESKTFIFPMGIRDIKFKAINSIKPKNVKENGKIRFTFIGRFTEKKGVENLLFDFKKLIKYFNNLELVLCGSGMLLNKYKLLIKELNMENNVTITDKFLSTGELKYMYENSNFIVIPSIKVSNGDVEGLPVVLIESLYFGKISISSKDTNAEEVVTDKINGFIYDSKLKDGFFEIANQILNNKFDLKKVEQNAIKEGLKYESKNVAKVYYDHLLS